MDSDTTIPVEPIEGYDALRMTWQHQVTDHDVKAAFEQITDALERTDTPLYVVVDLLSDPNFPLRTTVAAALRAYRHPRLAAWLIVGSNWMAKTIESTLSSLTRRKNVYWFAAEPEAIAYIGQNRDIVDRLQDA